jgi:hypothetical protein
MINRMMLDLLWPKMHCFPPICGSSWRMCSDWAAPGSWSLHTSTQVV